MLGKHGDAPVAIKKDFPEIFFSFTSTLFPSINLASPLIKLMPYSSIKSKYFFGFEVH